MEIEDIKNQIQFAINAVKDFDEPYRTKAFEVILSKLIEGRPTEKKIEPSEVKKKKISTLNGKIAEFAKAANITAEQLGNVFDFKEQDLTFIAPLTGSLADRQFQFCESILIGSELVYGNKWTKASILTKKMDDYGLHTRNLARNLARRSGIFRRTGQKRGSKWKLTDVGIREALDLVRRIATSA